MSVKIQKSAETCQSYHRIHIVETLCLVFVHRDNVNCDFLQQTSVRT